MTELIEILNEMIIHPIVRDMLVEDLNKGVIKTEKELRENAEEYTNML